MNARNAKRRASRRAKSAGAIIFIVAMTLAVLASLGLYALSAASNEIKTSGYERQNAQNQYLAEYALLATAQRIDPGAALVYYGQMMSPKTLVSGTLYSGTQYDPTLPYNGCYALAGVAATVPSPAAKACRRIQRNEFADVWLPSATPQIDRALAPSSIATPGSLGGVAMDGDFEVEITDAVKGALSPGTGGGTMCDMRFTVTAIGRTMPTSATAVVKYGGEGIALTRAQILVPNVMPCPSN